MRIKNQVEILSYFLRILLMPLMIRRVMMIDPRRGKRIMRVGSGELDLFDDLDIQMLKIN
ncbi:MAG: hypothetical protein MHMPM18_002964 [Marteilia pararefringens]